MVCGVYNGTDTELKQCRGGGEASWPKAAKKILSLLVHEPCGVSLYVGKNVSMCRCQRNHQQYKCPFIGINQSLINKIQA